MHQHNYQLYQLNTRFFNALAINKLYLDRYCSHQCV